MVCILRVRGTSFDVNAFLQASTLRPYKIWHKGEPMARIGRRANRLHDESGFNCDVSKTEGDLRGQLPDAIAFLEQNRTELERLAATPGVEECQLDFGIYSRAVRDGAMMQFEHLPVPFLRLVGELGIAVEISIYSAIDDPE